MKKLTRKDESMPNKKMTVEDKEIVLSMYKAHYSAREVSNVFPWSYSTVISMFRVYAELKIQKYDRITLLEATR